MLQARQVVDSTAAANSINIDKQSRPMLERTWTRVICSSLCRFWSYTLRDSSDEVVGCPK